MHQNVFSVDDKKNKEPETPTKEPRKLVSRELIDGVEDYDGSGDGTTNCYHQDYYCNPTAENLIQRVVNTAITKVSDCSDECNKYENDLNMPIKY